MSLFPAFAKAQERREPSADADIELFERALEDSRAANASAEQPVFALLPPEDETRPSAAAPAAADPLSDAPRPLDISDLSRLMIDRDGRLYWDGRMVETQHRFALSSRQTAAAVLIAAVLTLGALGAVIQGAAAARDWVCWLGWSAGACTPSARTDIPA